jgi:hypothetical protein
VSEVAQKGHSLNRRGDRHQLAAVSTAIAVVASFVAVDVAIAALADAAGNVEITDSTALYCGTSMQQPTEQYCPDGQAPALQVVVPLGQVALPLHDAGRVDGSWPGHSTQLSPPHGVPQAVFFSHVRQAAGS